MTVYTPTLSLPETAAVASPRAVAQPTAPVAAPVATRPAVMNNRPVYLAWAGAWLAGYGLLALGPTLGLPSLVGNAVLVAGLVLATAVTVLETIRGQRGVTGPAKTAGTLFGIAWATGFGALFLLITAVAGQAGDPTLQTLLWPTGSAVVVGLMYLMGGALQRDLVQYVLGTWLALLGAAAMFADVGPHYAVLVLAGVPAYLVAAALEGRRRAGVIRAAHATS